MKPDQQISRNALVWIIISMFTLVAPHAGRIPVWVLAVYIFAAIWRIMVFQGRWSFPGRWVKAGLIVSGFAGIYFSYGSLLGLEPTIALLLTAFALKLMELNQRKDGYVLLFLAYFICITEFLFSQELPVVVYSMLNVTLVTTALIAMHRPGEHQFNRKSIRLAAVMLLQALPLMVVLFFLFPRIGPLWSVPLKSHTAKTGVSDFMKPGDISRLGKSDEVAFRVQFEGEIPPQSELYWRGLVMSKLEDGAWRSLRYYDLPPDQRRPRPTFSPAGGNTRSKAGFGSRQDAKTQRVSQRELPREGRLRDLDDGVPKTRRDVAGGVANDCLQAFVETPSSQPMERGSRHCRRTAHAGAAGDQQALSVAAQQLGQDGDAALQQRR